MNIFSFLTSWATAYWQVAKLKTDLASAESSLEACRGNLTTLILEKNLALDDLKAAQEQISKWELVLEDKDKKITALNRAISDLDKTISDLNATIEPLQKKVKDLTPAPFPEDILITTSGQYVKQAHIDYLKSMLVGTRMAGLLTIAGVKEIRFIPQEELLKLAPSLPPNATATIYGSDTLLLADTLYGPPWRDLPGCVLHEAVGHLWCKHEGLDYHNELYAYAAWQWFELHFPDWADVFKTHPGAMGLL